MPKMIFTKDYSYAPKPQLPTRVYKASKKAQPVNQDCFDRATAAGFGHASPEKKTKKKDESGPA